MNTSTKRNDTVYRGQRVFDGHDRGIGVIVTANGLPLKLPPAFGTGGFEWGYGGHGPRVLAIALILDATGSPRLATEAAVWFMWGRVSCWRNHWSITSGEIREWVDQCLREQVRPAEDLDGERPVCGRIGPVRRCRECGCTDADCRQCIAATGRPCRWVAGEPDLCTRCAAALDADVAAVGAIFRQMAAEGGDR